MLLRNWWTKYSSHFKKPPARIKYHSYLFQCKKMPFHRQRWSDDVNRQSHEHQLTCFLCIMKYSEWYMWLVSGSSIQIQNGSPVLPCARSFHLKLPRILSTTRSTVRVMGWMDASTSSSGICLTQSFTRAPMLTWRIMWPTHGDDGWCKTILKMCKSTYSTIHNWM